MLHLDAVLIHQRRLALSDIVDVARAFIVQFERLRLLLVGVVFSVAVRNLCAADPHLQALHARDHLAGLL